MRAMEEKNGTVLNCYSCIILSSSIYLLIEICIYHLSIYACRFEIAFYSFIFCHPLSRPDGLQELSSGSVFDLSEDIRETIKAVLGLSVDSE